MKFGIVVFPGSNCERDCFYLINNLLKQPAEYLWHQQRGLNGANCIVLPGGFSYGDYLRTGAVARFSPIMKAVINFAKRGGIVIGICNGFQILLESGLLPGAMLRNKKLRFICKYVYLRVENNNTRFTALAGEKQVLRMPIAHNEGNYYIGQKGLSSLKENRQIVFRYANGEGEAAAHFNPNGALDNIAGIINRQGNVLGMMPHPERSSESCLGSRDGLLIFKSMLKVLKTADA